MPFGPPSGARVCIIEKNAMGGICTQRGCIPTKHLHSIGDIIRRTVAAKKHGINATLPDEVGSTIDLLKGFWVGGRNS